MTPDVIFRDGSRVHIKGNVYTTYFSGEKPARIIGVSKDSKGASELRKHVGKEIIEIKADTDGVVNGSRSLKLTDPTTLKEVSS